MNNYDILYTVLERRNGGMTLNDVHEGDVFRLKLTKERCMIIRKGNEQVVVRTPNYKQFWAYLYELEKAED